MKNYRGEKVLIAGLGIHGGGAASVKYFVDQGAEVTVTDLKTKEELSSDLKKLEGLKVRYVLGKHEIGDFENADLVVQNPSIPDDSKYIKAAKENGVEVDFDFGIFIERMNLENLFGVTGTKGKTTTTSLFFQMVKKKNSNAVIGGGVDSGPLDIIKEVKRDTIVVMEMSNLRLKALFKHKKSPRMAIFTNIFRDHLDKHVDMRDYIETKKNIFKYQNEGDFVILNYDDPIVAGFADEAIGKVCFFSTKSKIKQGAFIKDGKMVVNFNNEENAILDIGKIKLRGKHNVANVLAAGMAAYVFGVEPRDIADVTRNFSGLAHRIEFVREIGGVKYFNDTTATVPEATIAAMDSFEEPIVLIAGGSEKHCDYDGLGKIISKKVKFLILFDDKASKRIEQSVKKFNPEFSISYAKSMSQALDLARQFSVHGDIILLSPAAASFGLFNDEFDRGNQFVKLVKLIEN